MAGDDRLSALPDDLLRRVLYFVPFKEAASTSVLSRRWGSLWRSSGAVNLDVRVRSDREDPYSLMEKDLIFSHRYAFVRAAKAALDAAAAARVTRLTLRVEDASGGGKTYRFLHGSSDGILADDVVGALVSHPAAHRVEELRIAAVTGMEDSLRSSEEEIERTEGSYRLSSLPSKTLRVLDLTRCYSLAPPATDTFPRLETLRLRLCTVSSSHILALMDAAPRLATVHLQSVLLCATAAAPSVRLRGRAVTELVLESCGMDGELRNGNKVRIEIDAPRLRYFRYKGTERPFSLKSPAPDMAVLELHLLPGHKTNLYYHEVNSTRLLFWQFLRNFTSARALKLKVNYLGNIAVVGKESQTELLCMFHNAVRLELEGTHLPMSNKSAAVAIANLLGCCPVVRDLRLKLSTAPSNYVNDKIVAAPFLEEKNRLDYDKSVDRFMRRRRLNPVISLDDCEKHDEVPRDVPGLSGHSLTCLHNSLRRVGLQFRRDDFSCFGIQLLKFFTDNARLLQELCVDSGNRKLCEHMNLNVERWIVPSSSKFSLKRKNRAESSWEFSEIPRKCPNSRTDLTRPATSFKVLPLER